MVPRDLRGHGVRAGIASLSYVLVAFRNDTEHVKRLAKALFESGAARNIPTEVIVVSNDESGGEQYDGVDLVHGHGNVGFAAGIGLGVKAATGEYVVLVNPDCEPDVDEFVRFVDHASLERRINMPLLYDGAGKFDYMPYENWTFTLDRTVSAVLCKRRLLTSVEREIPRYAKISGAYVGMPRSVALELDCPFDDAYFLYAEDRDMTDRARKLGIPLRLLPDVRITHIGGESGKSVSGLVERCKADGSLRVAYRRLGRVGAVLFASDLLAVDAVKRVLRRHSPLSDHRWAVQRWFRAGFQDPGRPELAAITGQTDD
ncbi:glycosyltransferase family 2 protein [Prescottella equi]|nr:glycosyltransferase family 2 protein [Prescottella equi]